jgi:hypothetical protein
MEKKPKPRDLTGDGGVLKEVIREGTGELPEAGKQIFGNKVSQKVAAFC